MPIVKMPDGTQVRFPDEMPKEQIKSLIASKFPDAVKGLSQAAPKAGRVPEEKSWLRTADDAVRGAADMMTFGLADEFSAKMGDLTGIGGQSGNYDANLEAQRARDAEGGGARLTGQLAGALVMPGAGARTVGGAVLQGAGQGAAYGFGSGEGGFENRLEEGAYGGLAGGALGGAVRAATNQLGKRFARAAIPTNEAIRKSADAAYKAAEDAGAIIKPESTQRLTQSVISDLDDFGYDAALQPGVGAVINRLQGLEGQNLTMKRLDTIRKVAGNAAKDHNNPSQQALAGRIIDHIDDFMGDLKPADIVAGDSKTAANEYLKARSLWGKLKKSEAVDTAALRAEWRAASTGSGGNADNALRQNVRRLVENPKTARGMSNAEKKAALAVVKGTKTQNALRLVGKLSPSGNGVMAAAGIGGAMVNPVYGVPALVGLGAKSVADRMTLQNAEKLSELVRSGGMTVQDIAKGMRDGLIPAPVAFQVVERLGLSAQNPASRIGSIGAERVQN